MNNKTLPAYAQTIIVGGGSIGVNIAHELTKLGHSDVVLLEMNQLTAGTTWHAAGLIAAADIHDETSLAVYTYGRDSFKTLEEKTGMATGFHQVGYIQLVKDEERLHYMRRVAAFQRKHGAECREISVDEAKERFPHAQYDDVIAAFYWPQDGRINPVDVTMALGKAARMGGARIFENTGVAELLFENGRASGVVTTGGHAISAENVVLAGGLWTRQLAAKYGINLPQQAAEHYYLITEDMGLSKDLPIVEDPHAYTYYREEGGGMMLGLFEPDDGAAWCLDEAPETFAFGELNPDWERMTPHLEKSYSRVPQALDAGVRKFFCGPESFTPDISPLMGETAEYRNLFVATGLNSTGILNGPGYGRLMAQWIVNGYPDLDVSAINVNRFSNEVTTRTYRKDRTREVLGKMFGDKYPNKSFVGGRNYKQTVLYERLKEAGCFFMEGMGWETPEWFAPAREQAVVEKYSWSRQNWWPYMEAEVRACRSDVALADFSDMVKFQVEGPGALSLLNRLSANDIDLGVGRIVYTQWCNERGGIEADLTVTCLEKDKYMVMTAPGTDGHVKMHMLRHKRNDEFVVINDVTSAYTQLNIHGPKARELMQSLTHYDMSNENFPFTHVRDIDIGYHTVTATRVTYVGELGWELTIPNNMAVQVYDRIVEAGKAFGLRHIGLNAIMCLRMEKGYREYGHDLDNTENPYDAGLGFAVKLDKEGGFVGRDALAEIKATGTPKRRMVQFLLEDPEPLLYGEELIYRNGEYVGYISSAAYGVTLGGAMGLGYVQMDEPVTADVVNNGDFELEVSGKRYKAKASLRPMYDPMMEKIKC